MKIKLLMLSLVFLTGCGGQKSVSVSGVVTVQNAPAKDMAVLFQPVNGGSPGVATTDADGKYVIKTLDKKKNGIVPGEYTVFINWKDPDAPLFQPEGYVPKKSPYENAMKERLKMQDPSFSFVVPENGTSEANFDL